MPDTCRIERLIELNMWKVDQRILFLNKYWFGINPLLDIKSFDKAFSHDATKYIFEYGVFGFDNQKNNENYTIHSVRNNQKTELWYKANKAYSVPRL